MIVFRYLCKEILGTLLSTTLILLIIFMTNQFVHYLNDAAAGKITVKAVMTVMSLQVPLLLGYLLPLGFFLGGLLALGRMVVDHEMVILTACGVSRSQIMGIIMTLASFIAVIVAWLMLFVEPKMQCYRVKILKDAVSTASLEKIVPGRFQLLNNNTLVFYAGGINNHQHQMIDVFLAQSQTSGGKKRWDLVSADAAEEFNIARGERFILFKNGVRYIGMPGQLKYDIIKFREYGVRLSSLEMDMVNRADAMPTAKLWHLRTKDIKAAAELQWRIAMSLSVWLFALLIVPLSVVNPRKGKFAKILPAVLIYIGYANLMFFARALIGDGLVSQSVGLWWILVLLLALAVSLLFFQSHWWRRQFRCRKGVVCGF